MTPLLKTIARSSVLQALRELCEADYINYRIDEDGKTKIYQVLPDGISAIAAFRTSLLSITGGIN